MRSVWHNWGRWPERQPALFELQTDCRPRAERTSAGRYREPKLAERHVRRTPWRIRTSRSTTLSGLASPFAFASSATSWAVRRPNITRASLFFHSSSCWRRKSHRRCQLKPWPLTIRMFGFAMIASLACRVMNAKAPPMARRGALCSILACQHDG